MQDSRYVCTDPVYREPGNCPLSRIFLTQVIALVFFVRVGITILPFKIMRRIVCSLRTHSSLTKRSAGELSLAVRAASRFVPRATCLTQALAIQILMRRRGIPSKIIIGVTKPDRQTLESHAWVESGGRVVLGGELDLDRFAVLAEWS
jgi:transglutaminase superfamily protein